MTEDVGNLRDVGMLGGGGPGFGGVIRKRP